MILSLREIEEAKRRSILERTLNSNVGERSVDDVGETMKVMVVLYVATTLGWSDRFFLFVREIKRSGHARLQLVIVSCVYQIY